MNTRCKHGMIEGTCAICKGTSFFDTRSHVAAGDLAMNGGQRWTSQEKTLLLAECGDEDLVPSSPVFAKFGTQFGRTSQACYDMWLNESGRSNRSA